MNAMRERIGRLRSAARGKPSVVVITVLAMAWGRLRGGTVTWNAEHRMYVCAGMRAGFARGGTCVGGVFLTGIADPRDRLLRHESVHVEQWARHGVTFPFRYMREEMRNPGYRNRFEVAAGLEDGGYTKGSGRAPRPRRRPVIVRKAGRSRIDSPPAAGPHTNGSGPSVNGSGPATPGT